MISKIRSGIAKQVGEATATGHFLIFLNPKFRGPKFTWDDLPELAAKMASAQVGMAGSFGDDRKEMDMIAEEYAKHTIERCFRGWRGSVRASSLAILRSSYLAENNDTPKF